MEIYNICEKYSSIKKFPSLLGLKVAFKELGEETKPLYFIGFKKPLQILPLGMAQTPSSSFNTWSNMYNP